MEKNIRILLMLICLLPACVTGVTISNLYETEVPVENLQPESRKPAISTALGRVLIKITGDRYAPRNPALLPLLQRAENYVREYSYPDDSRLRLRFDDERLSGDLRNLGIPVWGKERPSTLIWLVINKEDGREILGIDGNPEYTSSIDNRARQRGIAIIFPLLDLEDSTNLRPSDIRGGFLQTVLDASKRYPADSILTGSIESPVQGIWEGKWTAYIGGNTETWQTEGELPEIVIEEGIDGMSDFLAQKFIQIDVNDQNRVRIAVADIYNIDQYARTLKYLESLSFVSRVQVSNVINGEVTFVLEAHGGCMAVSQAIELGRRLEPITRSECSKYRLLP